MLGTWRSCTNKTFTRDACHLTWDLGRWSSKRCSGNIDQSSDVYIAQAIVILENYDGGDDIRSTFHTPKVANRLTDLRCSSSPKSALPSRRDLLKFLSRRISCSCLKEKYRYARQTLPKFSACSWCGQQKKRELILVCSDCKIKLYCGKVCQAASWNNVHKHECAHFVAYQCMWGEVLNDI